MLQERQLREGGSETKSLGLIMAYTIINDKTGTHLVTITVENISQVCNQSVDDSLYLCVHFGQVLTSYEERV